MKDRIIHVGIHSHCCQFMYKGYQVSLTTLHPQEVAVFSDPDSNSALYTTYTVEEAIDWINAQ